MSGDYNSASERENTKMSRVLILTMSLVCLAAHVFGADCESVVAISQRVENGKSEYIAKNISGKPMIAYVIATDRRDANGDFVQVFSGVFTEGDSFRPGASIAIGAMPTGDSDSKPVVDYVRLARGRSCGPASTKQAKEVIRRFHN